MINEDKISIILDYIRQYLPLEGEKELAVRTGVIDGLLKIQNIETAERAARNDTIEVPVERVQEGFAFWQRGGFDTKRGCGSAMLAAGMDGGKLRKLRTVAEKNGRHTLVVVYPGCFIAESKALELGIPSLIAYQIVRFVSNGEGYAALCRKVWRRQPYFCSLPDDQIIAELIGVTGDLSMAPNQYRLDW